MFKRNSNHITPRFKPEVISVNNRGKRAVVAKNEKVEVLAQPIKSEADKKLYKTIRLQNGLTALLISDSSAPKSGSSDGSNEKLAACALSVNVGSYSNPPDIQGLAHFVEHMVFMGSEKYPKENEFDSFVMDNGGSDNASTDAEVTTYFFEIQENSLQHGMDIFSQMFASPLMKKEAMQREREAIQSEFAIAAPSDAYRKDQLLRSLFPKGHPARTFIFGNLKSLRDDIGDDEKLYKAAHEFRKRHYSAHRMTVAVQAGLDLATLEKYVVNTFDKIQNNKLAPDDFSKFNSNGTAPTPEFNKIYYVKPVSDITEVQLTWCMRSVISEYQSKPHDYISELLGHEGKGSLLSYLRKKVWALSISAGNSQGGTDNASMYSLFSTEIVLTKDGLAHIDEVLEAIFSYIEMLRRTGPSERFYKEIKTIDDTGFKFEEETKPADYVQKLVQNMHYYPPEHYITGDWQYYKYDPKAITELLNSMRPDSVNIMILSNKHKTPIQYDSKESWFGTNYKKTEIPKPWMQKWLDASPIPEFHMPDKNIYITTDLNLIPPAEPYLVEADRIKIDIHTTNDMDMYNKVEKAPPTNVVLKKDDLIANINNFRLDQPNLLRKNSNMELWYRPDFKFSFPTALLYFYFITPLILMSPREACLLDLWTDVLKQGLSEQVYPANVAGLTHTLDVEDKGFSLKVSGYSQNLHLLVELITREMRSNTANVTESLFDAVREERARNYDDLLIKPDELARDIRMNVLRKPYITPRDKAMLVRNITLAELKEFNDRLFSKLYMQTLIQGNIPWDEAIRIADRVNQTIGWNSFAANEYPEVQIHQLPLGEKRVRVMGLNPLSTNSIIANYYQGEAVTPKDNAVLEVLNTLMSEPVFNTLRTQEQLGYSVSATWRYTFGVLGLSVEVNTEVDKFSVSYVDSRVEAFLKKFAGDMKELSEESLSDNKNSLIQVKHASDNELKDEVDRNWAEIMTREYKFQRLFKEADAIEKVNVTDVRTWVDNHFATGNKSQFRKLSVQVVGYNASTAASNPSQDLRNKYNLTYLDASQPGGDPAENQADFIKDIPSFANTLPIIEVPRKGLAQR